MTLVTLALFLAGLGLLVGGAELLVRGASRLAAAVGVSPLVIGLTVVAQGTSTPELAVSVYAALNGQADLALGNVVGSNICNVLLILGLSALIAPLVVAQQVVRLDVPIMIAVSALLLLIGLDGRLSRLEGLLLTAGAATYTIWAIRASRRESQAVRDEYAEGVETEPVRGAGAALVQVGLVVAGLVMLVLGSRWMVDGAVAFAQALGVSELVIGLTVVAVGTSLPELAASLVAALRGERDIAVGNVVGSNIFNILAVLGVSAVVSPAGVGVSQAALAFDMPVMVAVAVACLPVFFTGYVIGRGDGVLFLGYYVAYTVYLLLAAARHDALEGFRAVMLWFVLPITAVTLLALAAQSHRKGRSAPDGG